MREGKRGNSDNNHKVEQRERGKEETMITIIKQNKERGKEETMMIIIKQNDERGKKRKQ